MEKTPARVTKVHSSMQAQEVATKVKEIKEEEKKRDLPEKLQKRRKNILRHLLSAEMNVIVDRKDVQP